MRGGNKAIRFKKVFFDSTCSLHSTALLFRYLPHYNPNIVSFFLFLPVIVKVRLFFFRFFESEKDTQTYFMYTLAARAAALPIDTYTQVLSLVIQIPVETENLTAVVLHYIPSV